MEGPCVVRPVGDPGGRGVRSESGTDGNTEWSCCCRAGGARAGHTQSGRAIGLAWLGNRACSLEHEESASGMCHLVANLQSVITSSNKRKCLCSTV